jgi:hypothetical protein
MTMKNHSPFLILFNGIVILIMLSINNTSNPFTQISYAHIFTPNDYASFVSSADQLVVESKLSQENLANNNITLAQIHANNSVNILFGDILMEIYERNRDTADELTSDVRSLQSMSSNPSQQHQVNQLVAEINANVNETITSVMREQQSQGSNFIDQTVGLLKGLFGIGQQQQVDSNLQPLRFAELVDDALRAYGRRIMLVLT